MPEILHHKPARRQNIFVSGSGDKQALFAQSVSPNETIKIAEDFRERIRSFKILDLSALEHPEIFNILRKTYALY